MIKGVLQPGVYKASKDGWDNYELTVELKETEKSIILKMLDYKFRFSPAHIDMLFKTDFCHMDYREQENIPNGKYKAIIKKQGGGHALIYGMTIHLLCIHIEQVFPSILKNSK